MEKGDGAANGVSDPQGTCEVVRGKRPPRLWPRIFAYFVAYAILQPASRRYANGPECGGSPGKFVVAILLLESALTALVVSFSFRRSRRSPPPVQNPDQYEDPRWPGLASGVVNQLVVAATLYYISVTPTLLGGVVALRAWSLCASGMVDLVLHCRRRIRRAPGTLDAVAFVLALAAAVAPLVLDHRAKSTTAGSNVLLFVYIVAYVARLWLITLYKQRRADDRFEGTWFHREMMAAAALLPILIPWAVAVGALETAAHPWAPLLASAVLVVSYGATTILGYADRPAIFGMVITRCASILAGILATLTLMPTGGQRARPIDFGAAGIVIVAIGCLAVSERRRRRE